MDSKTVMWLWLMAQTPSLHAHGSRLHVWVKILTEALSHRGFHGVLTIIGETWLFSLHVYCLNSKNSKGDCIVVS